MMGESIPANKLEDYVGKEVAKKIMEDLKWDFNVFYDENKLDSEENDTFKQIIKIINIFRVIY